MIPKENNFAYIDGANLHRGVESSAWKLDYRRFRSWIRQKFGVTDAYLFIGLMPKHAGLYTSLQSKGYILVFKEIVYNHPVSVLLVSSDGDYAPLVRFWQEKKVSCTIVSPRPVAKCSILLKRTGVPIIYLEDMKHKLSFRSPK